MHRRDLLFFIKRLSFLLEGGMALLPALQVLATQSKKKARETIVSIAEAVEHGQSFSSALQSYPKYFAPEFIPIIKSGEDSGQLQLCLSSIGTEIERRKILRDKIISASVYPLIIGIGTVALSFFLILFIFPKIRSLFSSLHTSLPLSTRIIIFVSDFLHHYWWLVLIIIFLLITIFYILLQHYEKLRYQKDVFILKLPLFSTLISLYILSRFYRTLGMMLKAHIPLYRTLHYASQSLTYKPYQLALVTVSAQALAGKSLSYSLSTFPKLFPELSTQLIEVAETSGNLSSTLLYISEMYDREIDQCLKILLSVVEPILMIVMGLVVGFISLSIISPIYEITQNIHH